MRRASATHSSSSVALAVGGVVPGATIGARSEPPGGGRAGVARPREPRGEQRPAEAHDAVAVPQPEPVDNAWRDPGDRRRAHREAERLAHRRRSSARPPPQQAPAAAGSSRPTRRRLRRRGRSRRPTRSARSHGLDPLCTLARASTAAAEQHSRSMAKVGYFAHESADGTAFWKRVEQYYAQGNASYWAVGENIICGSPDLSVGRGDEGLDGEPRPPREHPRQGLARDRLRLRAARLRAGRVRRPHRSSSSPATSASAASALQTGRRRVAPFGEIRRKGLRMSGELDGKRIAFVATDMVEQVELTEPWKAVERGGRHARAARRIKDGRDPGLQPLRQGGHVPGRPAGRRRGRRRLRRARPARAASATRTSCGSTRTSSRVRRASFFEQGKPVAVICHGPWTLIEAGVVQGRTLTSWPSLRTDIRNAGANWVDEEVARRQRPRHEPQAGRPAGVLPQARRGVRRGHARAPAGHRRRAGGVRHQRYAQGGARSSVEERRPSKPLVAGSNPAGRILSGSEHPAVRGSLRCRPRRRPGGHARAVRVRPPRGGVGRRAPAHGLTEEAGRRRCTSSGSRARHVRRAADLCPHLGHAIAQGLEEGARGVVGPDGLSGKCGRGRRRPLELAWLTVLRRQGVRVAGMS